LRKKKLLKMLPKWHVVYGTIFTFVFAVIFPKVEIIYLGLIFLSSVLIDFDHYVVGARKIKSWNIGEVLRYHEVTLNKYDEERARGIRRKFDFHIFHAVEFHIIIFLLGFLWVGFFYIFIGMIFHSILDIIEMKVKDVLYQREFFFVKWLRDRHH